MSAELLPTEDSQKGRITQLSSLFFCPCVLPPLASSCAFSEHCGVRLQPASKNFWFLNVRLLLITVINHYRQINTKRKISEKSFASTFSLWFLCVFLLLPHSAYCLSRNIREKFRHFDPFMLALRAIISDNVVKQAKRWGSGKGGIWDSRNSFDAQTSKSFTYSLYTGGLFINIEICKFHSDEIFCLAKALRCLLLFDIILDGFIPISVR